jgi:hypothetical protein
MKVAKSPHSFFISLFGLFALILLNYLPIYRLMNSGLGLMVYYYYWSVLFLGIVGLLILWGSTQKTYLWINNLLKAHILLGGIGHLFYVQIRKSCSKI